MLACGRAVARHFIYDVSLSDIPSIIFSYKAGRDFFLACRGYIMERLFGLIARWQKCIV